MRIVIDMQGAQTESRFRGIGRYSISIAKAIAINRENHELLLALNGLFPETIEPIRAEFENLLPQENIRVWYSPGPVRECEPDNKLRRQAAELLREAFLSSLNPDIILIASLFEGYGDNAVTSIGKFDLQSKTAVILYDLIPLFQPEVYLPTATHREYYYRKIDFIKKVDLLLSISESAKNEAIGKLGILDNKIINISSAVESSFKPINLSARDIENLKSRYNITRKMVMYVPGGFDERKNFKNLIFAYAMLPEKIRAEHHLVIVSKICENNRKNLQKIGKKAGLKSDEMVLTGYVPDEDLIALYNIATLFVFPSKHEGFGLPALEAMSCSTPTIGSKTTSISEVICNPEALFDPESVESIALKMRRVLEDEGFRKTLKQHCLEYSKTFSWDNCAIKAIKHMENFSGSRKNLNKGYSTSLSALVQKLSSVLADPDSIEIKRVSISIAQNMYTGEERQLMVDVSELINRDSATGVQRVVRSYLNELLKDPPHGYRVEPVFATTHNGYQYARKFTKNFAGLNDSGLADSRLIWQRGDIFFALDMQHHVQLAQKSFYQKLRESGVYVKFMLYDLLPVQLNGFFCDSNAKGLHENWLEMIAGTDGAICISKATSDAFNNWIKENNVSLSPDFQNDWVHMGADINSSKPSKGIPDSAGKVLNILAGKPTFLSVGTIEPRKGHDQILRAFDVLWAQNTDVTLVFVGKSGWKTNSLIEKILSHPERDIRLFWLDGISDEYLEKIYGASTCLIAASLNEGFGLPLIEAAKYKIPIIARDIPVFREVAGEHGYYFSGQKPSDLAEAIKTWIKLYKSGLHPKSDNMPWFTWKKSVEKLKSILCGKNCRSKQLFVDISELMQHDVGTGIQRVVRSILSELIKKQPFGFRVEPVYASTGRGYRYARQFTLEFKKCPESSLTGDEPIEYKSGDLFLGLDLQPQVVVAHRDFYQKLRRHGVRVQFVVYDLLCILMPQFFLAGTSEGHSKWLKVVAESDGAICISKAVADELSGWIDKYRHERIRPFKISWFHLGVDLDKNGPLLSIPSDAEEKIQIIRSSPTFLMVGTLEPRKGHSQTLDAFEILWEQGKKVKLAIVGNPGWMVEKLTKRMKQHPEIGKRLFWFQGINDQYLGKIYASSTCLIAASEGEGFGLPLIEAAQHKLPIIARDIPVFREVAGKHAFFFHGRKAEDLAEAVQNWLKLYKTDSHPKSDDMPWLTWEQSTGHFLEAIDIF